MGAEEFLAVILLLPAVDSDLRTEKVENSWLLVCAILITAMKLIRHGCAAVPDMAAGFILPVVLLWPLFRIRALGAGDSKLLAVLGLLMGPHAVLRCLARAFLIGGILSAALLISCGTLKERMRVLRDYVRRWTETGELPPYREGIPGPADLHMTVPIFLSVLLWAGGV